MEIYDNRYFITNKRFLHCVGLWPYAPGRKIVERIVLTAILILTIPHIIGLMIHYRNVDLLMEHLYLVLVMLATHMKIFTLGVAEKQMKSVYESLADNYLMITEEKEKAILRKYSETGRTITIVYTAYLLSSFVFFVIPPAIPAVLNLIDRLPEPRPYEYIFPSEFLVKDKDAYYLGIYLWDLLSSFFIILAPMACDSNYSVVTQHCLSLYAIVKYRLLNLKKMRSQNSSVTGEESYSWLVEIIKLHQVALSFTKSIDETYSTCFFVLAMEHIVVIPLLCVLITANLYTDPVTALRFGIVFAGMLVHLFMIFWPGQKIIDHSSILMEYSYCNEWYETTPKTKKILGLFMLKCMEPSLLSAGGLILLNFENYFSIVKTAASYITVFSSFR